MPLYKFKITLKKDNCRPQGGRWRRVVVPANFSLLELHVVIQVVFGWENNHLHLFMRSGKRGSHFLDFVMYKVKDHEDDEPTPDTKEERIYKLSDVFNHQLSSMEYGYDLNVSIEEEAVWEHEIKFEGVVDADPMLNYPACIQGKWANRMEDHQDENEGGTLRPEFAGKDFNLQETQQKLQSVFGGKWPLKVDNKTLPQCYLCAYQHCSKCNGKCCDYCIKADIVNNPDLVARKEVEEEAEFEQKVEDVKMYLRAFFGWEG